MKTFTRLALHAALSGTLAVLAATPALANQDLFDDFENGDAAAAMAHIEAGGDPMIRDKKGMTLLHWAAWTGDIAMAQSLVERKVDVDARTANGMTPMMHACINGDPDMGRLLLGAGANVHAVKEWDVTCLHLAARSGRPEMVNLLLDAEADPLATLLIPGKERWMTALDGARKHTPWVLDTDAGRRLQRLTYEGTGCEGVIVLPSDKQLTILAERTLGKEARWKQIAELNGLGADKSYRLGDCLKLP